MALNDSFNIDTHFNLLAIWSQKLSLAIGLPHRGHGGRPGPRILKEQFLGADEWLEKGYWAIGVSSNVNAIRYDKDKAILWVAFASKALSPSRMYKYHGPLVSDAEKMFFSASLGKHIHAHYKNNQYTTEGPFVIV